MRSIRKEPIARLSLSRLSVGDVERWHTRLRAAGMADPGIKNQHGVLRAALAQAVRWAWVSSNVASMAKLRSTKVQQRDVMTVDDVRAVMTAAASIDPAAELAFRIAAVAGARRAELASLRWSDSHDGQLLIDSAIEITKRGDGSPELREAPTKTANVRTVTLDGDTVEMIGALRRARESYGPWMFGLGPDLVSPDRIRLVVEAGATDVRHRREVAPARPAPLVGHGRDWPGPRRANGAPGGVESQGGSVRADCGHVHVSTAAT